jgi:uncharacterized protein with von Willebrand factor type A (vWA) domain
MADALLAENVMQFARLLRRAGLPAGPAETIAATTALTHVDIGERAMVQAALRAVMIHRHDHAELFDAAVALFWRNPETDLAASLDGEAPVSQKSPPGARRLAEAMAAREAASTPAENRDAGASFSGAEQLNRMDFEAMSAAQITRAKTEIAKLRLPLDQRRTRRWRSGTQGRRIDLPATIRAALRSGGEVTRIVRARRITRPPPLVVLCDISGSMSRYTEIMLHFLHGLANDRDHVSVFLFGTRLSNISRELRHRDPEASLAVIARHVPDFAGGTRIGEALQKFNRDWARRVLGQGAVVLLLTDGLERDEADRLAAAMARLHRSSRRLIWLNPLLRWDGFSPLTQGARAMLPHVDEFRPVHNLASLSALIGALSAPPPRAQRGLV